MINNLYNTPPPYFILWNAVRDVTRWKQGYIGSPPPYFIVLASSVKTKEVKVIEFHRIEYLCFILPRLISFRPLVVDSPTPEMPGLSKKSIISPPPPTGVLNSYNIYIEYELGMGRLIVGKRCLLILINILDTYQSDNVLLSAKSYSRYTCDYYFTSLFCTIMAISRRNGRKPEVEDRMTS